ncbi:MFS transporter, partial [Dickeya dadantii]|nr:MFS transporter [Dickeya dadantii]
EICAVSPAIAATAATINIALDFNEEETSPRPASTPDITATRSDLFFDTDEKDSTTPNTNKEENPSLLDF